MNHCSCDCDACNCSCIEGSATLRIVLSMMTTIRQMHRTPRIHQRRDWTSSSLVPSAVAGARESTLTWLAVPDPSPPKTVLTATFMVFPGPGKTTNVAVNGVGGWATRGAGGVVGGAGLGHTGGRPGTSTEAARQTGGTMTESEGLSPYGSPRAGETMRRIRIHHLQAMKDRGERWAMLTA